MYIGLSSGRLVSPINKLSNPFRWMGAKFAVYEFGCPSESGLKGRKVPSLRRGRNRRGCRSKRGGKKRRALVGAAPETQLPTPSERRVGSSAWARRAKRKTDYSRTLIDVFVDLSVKRGKVKDFVRRLNNTGQDSQAATKRLNNLNGLMTKTRRSWFTLAKTSGDSPEFISIRFRLLVDAKRQLFDLERPAMEPPDWYGELRLEIPRGVPNDEERPADHIFECARCMRTTNLSICRMCGSRLTNANRPPRGRNRRGVGRPPRSNLAPPRRT